MLPKANKASMAGTMEAIKEYLRSCCGIIRAPLAYVIRKILVFETYGDYLKYSTLDDKIIARMLHLPPEKNRVLLEHSIQSVKVHTAMR